MGSLSSPLQKPRTALGDLPALWRLAAPGEGAGSALSVYLLGSQAWSSGMNLVLILRKFIFDFGRAGEEKMDDRKRREGPETLWGCPHNTTGSPHG